MKPDISTGGTGGRIIGRHGRDLLVSLGGMTGLGGAGRRGISGMGIGGVILALVERRVCLNRLPGSGGGATCVSVWAGGAGSCI